MVCKEIFLKVNEILSENKHGYSCRLVKDADSNASFTGYLVKKKGLYYYKANRVGVKINRSADLMHNKFKELLANYTIDPSHIEPLKIQLQYTWENLTESNTSEKKALSLKLNEVDEEFYNLRKHHAIGTVSVKYFRCIDITFNDY